MTGVLNAPRLLFGLVVAYFALFAVASHAQIEAFGASNVAGKGVWPSQAWPAQLEGMLRAKGYDVHVKNAGVSGDTTSAMLKRLGFAIPSGTTIVILDTSGGYYNNTKTNTSRERGTSDMRQIETQLKSRGITVIPESTADIAMTYRQSDHKHLTVEGHKLVATRLLPLVISALGGSHSSG